MTYPDLSSEYPITTDQIDAYQRDGHVRLPGVCSPEEVGVYRKAINEAAFANFPTGEDLLDDRPFLQTLNLRFKHDGVKAFVLARRFARIVALLNGVDAVRIFHEQALFKEAGSGLSAWHQDQYYWPLATDRATGMWMPLVDVSTDMGPICFASGSHRDGYLGHYKISDEAQSVFENVIKEKGWSVHQEPMKAGDATFHNAWIIHGATANATDRMREAMIVTYYPDGTKVDDLINPSRINDAKVFLGGKKPGDLADSQLNTVVYP
ncbi:MAG: phytanoyl-CoA dioxygenase family protein [Candidatus Latescibacteria bacterium]|jgi:ectoine hydroxylase-related dioxygenase (phytanoyl-CoA dioxygenase family)|nr:phytanoyl-CoA dioxygenase family protein [Candidatus Latescibacterota bacterium]